MQPQRIAAPLALALMVAALVAAPRANAQSADASAPASDAPDDATPSGDAAVPDDAAPAEVQAAARPVAVLVDTAPIGFDQFARTSPGHEASTNDGQLAATFVTDTLREALAQLGYATVPVPVLYEAARSLNLGFPVPADGLRALMAQLDGAIGVTAELRAGGGYYQATLRVRFPGESGERSRQILATHWTLGDSLRSTLTTLLAPAAIAGSGLSFPNAYGTPILPDMTNVTPPTPTHPLRIHGVGELALGAEPVFGPLGDPFVNFLAYVRGAYFPLDLLGIDLSVAYGNLRGRNGRVSNALFMAGLETAIVIAPPPRRNGTSGVYLPVRGEVGYLPLNGPVVRGTAGVAWSFTPAVRMEVDVLSLGVWVLPGTAAFSLDVGVQLMWDLGVQIPRRRHRRHRPANTDATNASPSSSS